MQWLLGVGLTTEVTAAIADWVHNCYLPVQTGTMEGREGRTIEELLPWGNTPLRRGLATREVVPGAQTGYFLAPWHRADDHGRCDIYLDAVEARTQGWLYELKSPRGTPLGEVFQEELGLDAQQQARFLVYREMLRAAGPAVPAPSLTGQYAGLRGLGALGAAGVAQGTAAGSASWLKGLFTWKGTGVAAATGAIRGLGAEFQRTIDSLSWLVGLARLPHLVGTLHCWPGQPGAHRALPVRDALGADPGHAISAARALLCGAPVYEFDAPLVGAGGCRGTAGGTHAPQSSDLLTGSSATVHGPDLEHGRDRAGDSPGAGGDGILMFWVFRAVGGLWRGTV